MVLAVTLVTDHIFTLLGHLQFFGDNAFAEAIAAIQDRKNWPQTPEAVAQTFWNARTAKNYDEMKILWPGSDSWVPGWDEICKDDPNVKFVFGTASKDGTKVPYASEEHFKKTGSYNVFIRHRY
jgi:hypothetical protein